MIEIYQDEMPLIFEEVLQAKAMQRLKKVDMNCGLLYTSSPFFQSIQPFSRFEHSLGVGLLAYRFTKSNTQSLAALFHDIATPAFSHVVDFMNGDHIQQESTELDTRRLIEEDALIVSSLKKHHISIDDVVDYHRYPICDNDSWKLSCDRLEYTLSNMVNYHLASIEEARMLLDDIVVNKEENELVFQSKEKACLFARYALECSKVYVADIDRYAMESLALLLKDAIERNALTMEDLYQDDAYVIEKLRMSCMKERYVQFTSLYDVEISNRDESDVLYVNAKRRYINPYIVGVGRVLDVDLELKEEVDAFLNRSFDYGIRGIYE